MQYLPYEKYVEYGGLLSQAAFILSERSAEREIDAATFGRIRAEFDGTQSYAPDLAILTAGLIEKAAECSLPVSESCDGVSASYNAQSQEDNIRGRLRLITVMLEGYKAKNGEPLLYRGAGCE